MNRGLQVCCALHVVPVALAFKQSPTLTRTLRVISRMMVVVKTRTCVISLTPPGAMHVSPGGGSPPASFGNDHRSELNHELPGSVRGFAERDAGVDFRCKRLSTLPDWRSR